MSGDIKLILSYDNDGSLKVVASESEKVLAKSGKAAGKKAGTNYSKAFSIGIKGAAKAAAALGAAVGAIGTVTLFKSIGLAREQEDAVNRLNSALQITGLYSKGTSEELQAYASSLQASSKFGDEAILSAQGLIQSLGNLDKEGLKGATQATLDLAAALKIDLNSAATLVGKAAAGEVGSFSRYGVSIKKGANNAETFARALTALNSKFGGAAAAEVNTFSGAYQQLSNSFGDLLEKIGDIVVKSPLIINVLKSLGTIFNTLGARVIDFGKKLNIFDDIITPIFSFNEAVITYVITPLELVANTGKVVFGAINSFVVTTIASFGFLGAKIGEFLQGLGIMDTASQALIDFGDTSGEVARNVNADFTKTLSGIADFPLSEKLATKNDELRTFFDEQSIVADEAIVNNKDKVSGATDDLAQVSITAAEGIGGVWEGLRFQMDTTAKTLANTAKGTANIIKNGLAKGIAGGVQNMVQSLAKGENVAENFGKFLLSTFGDLAIQLGQFWIAQGIAIEAANAVSGTGAVVAGVALVAVGSILKSFAGSGGSTSSAPSGGGTTSTPSFANSGDTATQGFSDTQTRAQAKTVVNFNVEGNVVDQEAFFRDVAEGISEEGGRQGLVFNNLATV